MDFSFNVILSTANLDNVETTKLEHFEEMESRILDFLYKHGIEFTNPSDHWSQKKKHPHHKRIFSDSESETNSPMVQKSENSLTAKRLSLSCPLFLKRKNKN